MDNSAPWATGPQSTYKSGFAVQTSEATSVGGVAGVPEKRAVPKKPKDLSGHEPLIYSSVLGDDVWRLTSAKGEAETVKVAGRLRSNNLSALLAAARSGLGNPAIPRYVAADSLVLGEVMTVLREYNLPEREIHALFPSPKLVPGKVQAFVAYLQGRFAERWWEALPKA